MNTRPTDEDVLNEIVKLLGSAPDKSTFRHDLSQNHEWNSAVLYILGQSEDITLRAAAKTIVSALGDKPISIRDPQSRLIILLQQMKREFEFNVGYSIPRNYLEIPEDVQADLTAANKALETSIVQDNELNDLDKKILLSEIAIFEASLGVERVSSELLARFVNGVLKGAIILSASEIIKNAASDLTAKLFSLLGWSLSG